jgi:hypothetical protein
MLEGSNSDLVVDVVFCKAVGILVMQSMLVVLHFHSFHSIQGLYLLVNSLSSIRLISLSYVFHKCIP